MSAHHTRQAEFVFRKRKGNDVGRTSDRPQAAVNTQVNACGVTAFVEAKNNATSSASPILPRGTLALNCSHNACLVSAFISPPNSPKGWANTKNISCTPAIANKY